MVMRIELGVLSNTEAVLDQIIVVLRRLTLAIEICVPCLLDIRLTHGRSAVRPTLRAGSEMQREI